MILETIKLSQREKEHLVQLKRRTKIANWNVLCRWAFAVSIAEASVPPDAKIASDSSIEMTWRVFGGEYAEVYAALMRHRCARDGLGTDAATLAKYFRLHLHRGIGYLFADRSLQGIRNLIEKTTTDQPRWKNSEPGDADPAGQDGTAES